MTAAVAERLKRITETARPAVQEWEATRPAPPPPAPEPAPVAKRPAPRPRPKTKPVPARVKIPACITVHDLPSREAIHHVLAAVAFRAGMEDTRALTLGGHMETEYRRRLRDVAIDAALIVGASKDAVQRALKIDRSTVTAAQGRVRDDADMRAHSAEIARDALAAASIKAKAQREAAREAVGTMARASKESGNG